MVRLCAVAWPVGMFEDSELAENVCGLCQAFLMVLLELTGLWKEMPPFWFAPREWKFNICLLGEISAHAGRQGIFTGLVYYLLNSYLPLSCYDTAYSIMAMPSYKNNRDGDQMGEV